MITSFSALAQVPMEAGNAGTVASSVVFLLTQKQGGVGEVV
jgi:hypothetical protein